MRLPLRSARRRSQRKRRDGALAVRLHGDAEAAPVVERRVGEGGGEDLQRRIETVLLLRVDGQRQAARACGARQRQHARGELGGEALLLAGLEARMQRRQLHRQPRAAVQRVGVHGARTAPPPGRRRRSPPGSARSRCRRPSACAPPRRACRRRTDSLSPRTPWRAPAPREWCARARTGRPAPSPPGGRPGG